MIAFTPAEYTALATIAFAAAVYAVREGLDLLGWAPSSKRLREENVDLIRRNEELDQTVNRLQSRLDELRTEVDELRKTNQAAVLRAIEAHERQADQRHERTFGVLVEIRDTLKTGATS